MSRMRLQRGKEDVFLLVVGKKQEKMTAFFEAPIDNGIKFVYNKCK